MIPRFGPNRPQDYLRLWHGGWHLCVSAMTYFSAGAPVTPAWPRDWTPLAFWKAQERTYNE